jgi:hypothetical protein
MFDKIKIGEGNYGNMAVRISHEIDFISQNNVSYWCDDKLLNVEIIIMKNSKEGKKLTEMLNKSLVDVNSIRKYILENVLKNIDISYFEEKIIELKEESFEEGVRNNQQKLREILGIIY